MISVFSVGFISWGGDYGVEVYTEKEEAWSHVRSLNRSENHVYNSPHPKEDQVNSVRDIPSIKQSNLLILKETKRLA